jgi:AAA family ATP:ADP antiporter
MSRFPFALKRFFEIRPDEYVRTGSMFVYLLSVLFAYYILKPVSRSMFLTRFEIDQLPWLYVLIAAFGGVFAYLYSKLASRTSLGAAVFWTMFVSVAALCAIWLLVGRPWMVYLLNVFVSLFSIVLVSQGWLVASNIFDARQAKRIYPLLGVGMVLGAAFGGEFTHRTALLLGTRNLLLASAAMVVLAYGAYRLSISGMRQSMKAARAANGHQEDFNFASLVKDIGRIRHLRVIAGMMISMYLVDTLVEYQFQAVASQAYHGDHLTAFFGQFYGLYLNAAELVFQLFLTSWVVRRFGVGGALQISPAAVALASIATLAAPGTFSAGAVRLTEASTRYTLNRTGMELLYMPLPQALRNRVKAFMDICIDRASRGIAGVLLLLLTATVFDFDVRGIAVAVMLLCVPWLYLSHLARREYIASIRRRFESRGLDFENARMTANDPATIRMLESTASSDNPRQAAYALELLAETPAYPLGPLLQKLARAGAPEVRSKAYELAASRGDRVIEEEARAEMQRSGTAAASAISYLILVSEDRARMATEALHGSAERIRAALEGLRGDRELATALITREWLESATRSTDPALREAAALAVAVRGDHGTEALYGLLADPSPRVACQACAAAGALRNRAYLFPLIHSLGNPRVRGSAIEALAQFGPSVCGVLAEVLMDNSQPLALRRQVPRVLRRIPHQHAADALLAAAGHEDLPARAAVLRALNHLREAAPELKFDGSWIKECIVNETRYSYELSAALDPFLSRTNGKAAQLLVRALGECLNAGLERVFRLLGLCLPPKEIYAAWRAVCHRRQERAAAALEFLDNMVDRNLKRYLFPLLDAPENLMEHGQQLFGLEPLAAAEAIRRLIRSRDPWLAACAISTAKELELYDLAPEIVDAVKEAQSELVEVASWAETALAA